MMDDSILSVVVGSRAYGLDTRGLRHRPAGVFVAPTEGSGAWTSRSHTGTGRCPSSSRGRSSASAGWPWRRTRRSWSACGRRSWRWHPGRASGCGTCAARSCRGARTGRSPRYADAQFRPLGPAAPKWKQAMHLIRLLLSGRTWSATASPWSRWRPTVTACWRSGGARCRGAEVTAWRAELTATGRAPASPSRPRHPGPPRGRRSFASTCARSAGELPDWLPEIPDEQPHPLAFATMSGAHLYGFPSADSDVDLRGVHVLPAGRSSASHRTGDPRPDLDA